MKNLRVLVTRPSHQAQGLCGLLQAAKAEVILFPTLEIIDIENKQQLSHVVENLSQFDMAIFVSINAVHKTIAHGFKKPKGLAIAAIGKATQKSLEQNHIHVDILPKTTFTSEALLALSEFQQVKHKHIVIFTGEGGRPLLVNTLRERGATVTKVATYRRIKPIVDMSHLLSAWRQTGIDVMVSTSGESLQNLIALTGPHNRSWLQSIPLVVVSERMVSLATSLGFAVCILAAGPSDQAIVNAIKDTTCLHKNH